MTFSNCKTEDGKITIYFSEGEFTDDVIEQEFFGCGGVARIDGLQDKLIRLARGGFKHHTTVANGHVKTILEEAFKYYLGYDVVSIDSADDGCVDLDAQRAAVGEDTAGLMLTNPNTVGIFDKNILEITKIVHEAGGLCYYNGANLNAVMGQARPGDMGFDCVHVNLHKTFSTPHGGGGPGSGPVGCKDFLAQYLPGFHIEGNATDGFHYAVGSKTMGAVKQFHGNFLVIVRALTYMLTLGKEGIPEASANAVLNANYMRVKLAGKYEMAYDVTCMHEFVIDVGELKHRTGASALDVAKRLLDYGFHPPTMYFPLIVHEALMVEPCETEPKEVMDDFINAMLEIYAQAEADAEVLHKAPHDTVIGRPDEVGAARNPIVKYTWED
jgi:glycine dehydrogenase subunit 2